MPQKNGGRRQGSSRPAIYGNPDKDREVVRGLIDSCAGGRVHVKRARRLVLRRQRSKR